MVRPADGTPPAQRRSAPGRRRPARRQGVGTRRVGSSKFSGRGCGRQPRPEHSRPMATVHCGMAPRAAALSGRSHRRCGSRTRERLAERSPVPKDSVESRANPMEPTCSSTATLRPRRAPQSDGEASDTTGVMETRRLAKASMRGRHACKRRERHRFFARLCHAQVDDARCGRYRILTGNFMHGLGLPKTFFRGSPPSPQPSRTFHADDPKLPALSGRRVSRRTWNSGWDG